MLDDVFNSKNFRSEIIWKRSTAHGDTKQGRIQPRAAQLLLATIQNNLRSLFLSSSRAFLKEEKNISLLVQITLNLN